MKSLINFPTGVCFILTMRNVNKKVAFSNTSEKLSFILTMRNVNGIWSRRV